MVILTIATTNLDDFINTYGVHTEDVVSESGESETGVSWDQRVRAGKATVNVGFTFDDTAYTAFFALITAASFSMTYQCRGATPTGTFKVRASDENMIGDDVWEVSITFKEL